MPRSWASFLMVLLLIGCSSTSEQANALKDMPPGVRGYKVGKPYRIRGIWYYPSVDYDYSEVGVASWYGPGFHGRSTANGEQYDMNDLTAAHRTLPMPSVVQVTNLGNGRSIKLRVNDRGPFVGNRIIDVSRRAAQLLGFHIDGTARVQVDIVPDESKQLAAALGVPIANSAPERRTDQPVTEIAAAYEVSAAVPPSPMLEPEVRPEAQPQVEPEIQLQQETQPEVQPEPRIGEAAMAYMPATGPGEAPETQYAGNRSCSRSPERFEQVCASGRIRRCRPRRPRSPAIIADRPDHHEPLAREWPRTAAGAGGAAVFRPRSGAGSGIRE